MIERRRLITMTVSAALIAGSLYLLCRPRRGEGVELTFLGGAGEVGGSCILVSSDDASFIVDCGSFGKAGADILPDDPGSLDFMILTHAHTDHCGMIPELFEAGFAGCVYCTPATAELVPIMLRMSRNFQRDRVAGEVFERSLEALSPVPFGERVVSGSVSFVFKRAQHLLGAAFTEVEIDTGSRSAGIVFSGDLGSGGSILLRPLEDPGGARYAVLESTYGGRIRGDGGMDLKSRYEQFGRSVASALGGGGDVLIPAFTMGRTQEVIAALDMMSDAGVIGTGTPVYIDSPTARKVTDVYRRFREEFSDDAKALYPGRLLSRPNHREVKSSTSMKVHGRDHRPTVFISSSGDLSHANSPRHLVRMASDPRALLCIVGWQSYGSAGRHLAEGDSTVLVSCSEKGGSMEAWLSPALRIEVFGAFSSHADQDGLLEFAGSIEGVETVFLVHGEPDQAAPLAARLESELGLEIRIPEAGENFFLPSR